MKELALPARHRWLCCPPRPQVAVAWIFLHPPSLARMPPRHPHLSGQRPSVRNRRSTHLRLPPFLAHVFWWTDGLLLRHAVYRWRLGFRRLSRCKTMLMMNPKYFGALWSLVSPFVGSAVADASKRCWFRILSFFSFRSWAKLANSWFSCWDLASMRSANCCDSFAMVSSASRQRSVRLDTSLCSVSARAAAIPVHSNSAIS